MKGDVKLMMQAIQGLQDALWAPDIIRHEDELVIEFPYAAGKRFEVWIMEQAAGSLGYYGMRPEVETLEGDKPYRSVTIGGIKFRWPLRRVALPNGEAIPEPLPTLQQGGYLKLG